MTFPGLPDALTPWPGAAYRPAPEPQTSSVAAKIVLVVACAVAGALLALAAGWVWVAVAHPPTAKVTADGLAFDPSYYDRAAGITLWFIVVTLAFGIVSGLVVAWRGYRHGVVTVLAILVMSVVGSLLTHWFGHRLFDADPEAQFKAAEVGDIITFGVELDTMTAYLGWPVGGMIGALAGVSGWPKRPIGSPSPRVE